MHSQGSNSPRDQSFASRASRLASRSSNRSAGLNFLRLPPHCEAILHGRNRSDLRRRDLIGHGLYWTRTLLPSLDRSLGHLPWDSDSTRPKKVSSSTVGEGSVKQRTTIGRPKKSVQPTTDSKANKYLKFYEIIDRNPYGKISFTNSNEPQEVIPNWVTYRLQDSCHNARFVLPSDYRKLEEMTPLQYLEKHTLLSPTQKRRYDLVFAKHMDKQSKSILFPSLYPALNSMFANSLGKHNFYILCIALFIPDGMTIQSKELFAGICAFTERLFWSSYIDSHEDTFFQMGPNRSLLECADFSGLQWKLTSLNISVEMKTLLFSLA